MTIEEARTQSERWPAAEEVRLAIEAAFQGVTLGNGVGLREAQGLDDYEDAAVCAALRLNDEKEDWRLISTEDLCACNSSLSFFDPEGMRFHLPAYLLADLRGEYGYGMEFCLAHVSLGGGSQFSLLSHPQREAVKQFLRYIADEPDYAMDRPEILKALDGFWRSQPEE